MICVTPKLVNNLEIPAPDEIAITAVSGAASFEAYDAVGVSSCSMISSCCQRILSTLILVISPNC